jgi:hypothetical protein
MHGGNLHEGTSKLLRGGPYTDRRKICFKCHVPEEYAKINPHLMQNGAGDILVVKGKPVCLLCHVIKPDPSKDRELNVKFRADIGFLCWRCHPPMPDSFFGKHFLITPSPKTLKYMKKTEDQDMVTLPLAPRGRITCSTCHNPHQKGVLSYSPAASGAEAPKKLREANMCGACHEIGRP